MSRQKSSIPARWKDLSWKAPSQPAGKISPGELHPSSPARDSLERPARTRVGAMLPNPRVASVPDKDRARPTQPAWTNGARRRTRIVQPMGDLIPTCHSRDPVGHSPTGDKYKSPRGAHGKGSESLYP
ncbi:hypothetical protein L1887_02234 [Cichorium endivia]|nr:hypothetical protein L1887_02234 [Cichorium endivia]